MNSLKAILLTGLFGVVLAAQSSVHTFIQGPTELKVSSVPIFANTEAVGFNQMVCARSYDVGVADLRVRGELTLTDFQVVRFDQIFARRTGADSGAWKHPTCQIILTAAVPLLQVTGLEVIPTRADPVIVFVPLPIGGNR
jgi:hypothetical protein